MIDPKAAPDTEYARHLSLVDRPCLVTGGADGIGAAVVEALSHLGKPYDYNFDFTSDNALVCSELIYKAFHASQDIQLEPEETNGRLLLSPNQMAIKFDNELGGDTAQLDFVLFLDGRDIDVVEERDAAAFRSAWQRPKWHILFT